MFLLLVISNVSPFSSAESFVPFGWGWDVGWHPPLLRPRVRVRVRVLHIANAFKKKPERNSSKFQSVNDPPSILYCS